MSKNINTNAKILRNWWTESGDSLLINILPATKLKKKNHKNIHKNSSSLILK
jgi:hypothetical protein